MSFHASANTFQVKGWEQFHRYAAEFDAAEEEARATLKTKMPTLSALLPEDDRWEAFWATVPEDANNQKILAMVKAEIKRLADEGAARDDEDDRQMYAELRRGG